MGKSKGYLRNQNRHRGRYFDHKANASMTSGQPVDLFFTRDYAQVKHNNTDYRKLVVQGGFLVIRPIYKEIAISIELDPCYCFPP